MTAHTHLVATRSRFAESTRRSVAAVALAALVSACSAAGSPASEAPSGTPTPTLRPTPTAAPSVPASERPTPSPAPSDDPSGDQAWIEADRFDEDGDVVLQVEDAGTWRGGFIAVGAAWLGGGTIYEHEPRVWTSPDGITWTQHEPDLGGMINLEAVIRLAAGDVVVLGTLTADGAAPETRAFRSADGTTWNPIDLPSELAGQATQTASGAIGTVVVTETEAWYSADMESWQRVLTAPTGVRLLTPAAGDEGFVITVGGSGADGNATYASGDGLEWVEGSPGNIFGIVPFGGDWIGWGYTEGDIAIYRSTNGLDFTQVTGVNDLVDPNGPQAGQGLEGITQVELNGEGRVLSLTLGFNHCCAQAPVGLGVLTSTDGETWTESDLPESAYVSALTTDGSVVVIAAHIDRGAGGIGFWTADR
jgi:hypothetical protein